MRAIIALLSRQHRPERLSAEDVDVEMADFLARSLAGVGEQAIALDDHFGVARDLADGADEAGDLGSEAFAEKSSHET